MTSTDIAILLGIIVATTFIVLVLFCAVAGQKSPEEQALEDEEQMAYLREYVKRKNAKKKRGAK